MAEVCPSLELFLEYGRADPGVRVCFAPSLAGAGLGVDLWFSEPDLSEPAVDKGGFMEGVLGDLRCGDSGRGNDCRSFGLKIGLGARAPGPTD